MQQDSYGLPLATQSAAARDAYVEGCRLFLTLYPGAVEAFERAIAADPGFVLAHVGLSRAYLLTGDGLASKAALAQAEALAEGAGERDRSQIAVFQRVAAAEADAALALVKAHLARWPRDVLVAGVAAGQLGLIALSGRMGRVQELADFLADLAPHFEEDWWFDAQYGMALSEAGQQARGRPYIERSLAREPANAIAAHSLAHLHYEEGAHDQAIAFLESWMPAYPAAGALHGHLNWHLALSLLEKGRVEEAFALYSSAFGAVDYTGPAIYKLSDAAAFLWRAELIGRPREPEKWRDLIALARRSFPKPSFPFADWHIAVSETVANDLASAERLAQLETLAQTGYVAGAAVLRVTKGLAAFERGDYAAAIEALEPAMAERPRLGGSSAQTDLVEFTLARAYLAAGRPAEAASLAAARRPGPSPVLAAGV